jgi:ABC-type transport system substrate-binding protein
MKRILSALLSVLLLAGIAAGCSTKEKAAAPGGKGSGEVVVTYSLAEDFYTWDTAGQPSIPSYIARILIYDRLIESDHKGNYTPSLATEWKASEDGKDWNLKLRKGVKFHNGEEFTAESVKATYERMAFDKTLAMNYLWTKLTAVEVVNDYEVIFRFSEPYGAFLSEISTAPILPAKALKAKGNDLFNTNPGTGAWKFVKWDPGNQAVFVRNDDYWNWGSTKSNVDKLIFKPISEDTTRVSGIRTGEISIAGDIPPDQISILKGVQGIHVIKDPGLTITWFALQTGKGKPFADINVRKAFTHSIDRKMIVENILGSGTPSYWPTMEGVIGYDANLKDKYAQYNPELARELLKNSSYKGQEIYFMAINGKVPRTKEVLQAVMSMMTEVGFKVKLEVMEGATFVSKRSAGNYDLAFSNIFYGNGSSLNHANMHYVTDSAHTEYVNQKQVGLMKLATKTVDLTKQNELMRQAFQITMEEAAPVVYLLSLDCIAAYKSDLDNVVVFPDGVMDLRRVMKK